MKEQEFIQWLNIYLLGKDNLTPAQVDVLKKKLSELKTSTVSIQHITPEPQGFDRFERPKPETLIEYPTFTFTKKDESEIQ